MKHNILFTVNLTSHFLFTLDWILRRGRDAEITACDGIHNTIWYCLNWNKKLRSTYFTDYYLLSLIIINIIISNEPAVYSQVVKPCSTN